MTKYAVSDDDSVGIGAVVVCVEARNDEGYVQAKLADGTWIDAFTVFECENLAVCF